MYIRVNVHIFATASMWWSEDRIWELILSPCGFWGWNWSHQAWWWVLVTHTNYGKIINNADHPLVLSLLEFSCLYVKFYFVFYRVKCAKYCTVPMLSSYWQIGSNFLCQHTKIHPMIVDGSEICTYVLFLWITWITICGPISNPTFYFCLLCKLQFYAEYPCSYVYTLVWFCL